VYTKSGGVCDGVGGSEGAEREREKQRGVKADKNEIMIQKSGGDTDRPVCAN
jgi:hypothetical protein